MVTDIEDDVADLMEVAKETKVGSGGEQRKDRKSYLCLGKNTNRLYDH